MFGEMRIVRDNMPQQRLPTLWIGWQASCGKKLTDDFSKFVFNLLIVEQRDDLVSG